MRNVEPNTLVSEYSFVGVDAGKAILIAGLILTVYRVISREETANVPVLRVIRMVFGFR